MTSRSIMSKSICTLMVAVATSLCLPALATPADTTPSTPAAQAGAMRHEHADDAPVASPAAERAVPAGTVDARTVEYGRIEGQPLSGYFARPAHAHGTRPGVILFHEWWGLNDNIRSMADQLAAQGYDALAADLYGGASATTPGQAQKLMQAALGDMPKIDRNIDAAYAFLQAQAPGGKPRKIATIGWCFGGSISFEAAQELSGKLAATVIYYGFVNDKPEALSKMKAPVLAFFGAQDPGIPPATAEAFRKGLEALGAHPQVYIYPDAGHAFANPSGKHYRARDAEDAWGKTLVFLSSTLR
jgi:carboxymethylenebutenolidase